MEWGLGLCGFGKKDYSSLKFLKTIKKAILASLTRELGKERLIDHRVLETI